MLNFLNSILAFFDAVIVRRSSYLRLANASSKFRLYEFSEVVSKNYQNIYFSKLSCSKSQLGQDLFVLNELNFKNSGFFVEFGATNGVDLSNSYLLEKDFGWNGILSEPAKIWRDELAVNRACQISFDCVWKTSGDSLIFNEVNDDLHSGELSTIDQFSGSDGHSAARKFANRYEVKTISLRDLLRNHNAPRDIDYLSIDTEGSEYEILSAFDFDEYNIKVITCEHNYTPMRQKIYELLKANGYERKHRIFAV